MRNEVSTRDPRGVGSERPAREKVRKVPQGLDLNNFRARKKFTLGKKPKP